MPLQAKFIKQKIKSVGNIKKITKTMQMVSASKMRKAVDTSLQTREYARSALMILRSLVKRGDITHPLLVRRDSGKILIAIIASHKGLAGAYNVNISKVVTRHVQEHGSENIDCICMGKQSEKIARRLRLNIIASMLDVKDFASSDDAHRLAMLLIQEFTEHDYVHVHIVATQFIKPLTYEARLQNIFPLHVEHLQNFFKLKEEELEKGLVRYAELIFEPSLQIVLNQVLPQMITALIYQVLLDAYASEHSSRMVAMQNATENAGQLQDRLKLSYNKARQAGITQEIAEISAGAEALR